jgi:hypothetical protein
MTSVVGEVFGGELKWWRKEKDGDLWSFGGSVGAFPSGGRRKRRLKGDFLLSAIKGIKLQ